LVGYYVIVAAVCQATDQNGLQPTGERFDAEFHTASDSPPAIARSDALAENLGQTRVRLIHGNDLI
jgi:hypothetical protein